uniref:Uncharacterized protein n=1 Tax=Candidatus Kentrum sp. MB TaxID=2138164 RepID=A0A450XZT1_9GAMM|nr:MAG: hypothetical protein BECKMB1821G_GA0114241_100966 [Candidatus Kentron sp. MB]VFK34798.1 MAG: hypothetical protein BECKMB1821I_GA0114274_10852 [Candidatus Kentron sp. MB]VFK74197.1 MAG: hypothetical protein BECKMB1821H_GA0114242_100216 [Candidatus Kentron sp. MB]
MVFAGLRDKRVVISLLSTRYRRKLLHCSSQFCPGISRSMDSVTGICNKNSIPHYYALSEEAFRGTGKRPRVTSAISHFPGKS